MKQTILTGLRANNDLHIGNYFGALLPIVRMAQDRSDEYNVNLFIPDLHSFTTEIDHSQLQKQIQDNIKAFVAAGLPLDKPNIHIYRQSRVAAHSELTWILDCFTGMGEMSRMTQFKDKSEGLNSDRVSVGLFNYPVLMASDILLYGAEYVPVGDDQSQHIEFTRDIGERFNKKFGAEVFTLPKSVKEQHQFFGAGQGLRIKDLVDPAKKMSKSSDSSKGVIFLSDSPEEAKKKIMSATTDNDSSIKFDPTNKPGISNLLQILELIKGPSNLPIEQAYSNETSYGKFKADVAEEVAKFLTNFQSNLKSLDLELVEQKITESENEMNNVANETLTSVQKAVGLR